MDPGGALDSPVVPEFRSELPWLLVWEGWGKAEDEQIVASGRTPLTNGHTHWHSGSHDAQRLRPARAHDSARHGRATIGCHGPTTWHGSSAWPTTHGSSPWYGSTTWSSTWHAAWYGTTTRSSQHGLSVWGWTRTSSIQIITSLFIFCVPFWRTACLGVVSKKARKIFFFFFFISKILCLSKSFFSNIPEICERNFVYIWCKWICNLICRKESLNFFWQHFYIFAENVPYVCTVYFVDGLAIKLPIFSGSLSREASRFFGPHGWGSRLGGVVVVLVAPSPPHCTAWDS